MATNKLPLTAEREARVPSPSANRMPSLHILVVDDNADAATSLGRLLSLLGHSVRVVHDGAAALAAIDAFAPAVVLLDLGMPGMDGLETAQRIRRRAGKANPALIAVTGWGQERDHQLTADAGFTAHLVKPVNLNQLEAALSLVVSPC